MPDFQFLAFVHIAVGYQIYLLCFAVNGYRGTNDNIPDQDQAEDDAIQAMLIIGFLSYCATFLVFSLIRFGNLKGNKIALICSCILAFVAFVFILIGIAIYGADVGNPAANPYTEYVISMTLALIGAIFLLLSILGK